MPCSSLKKPIQKQAAPTPSSRGSVSGCRGMCRHHASPSTNEHMPVAPRSTMQSFLSIHLINRGIRNNAPSPRRKPSSGSHDSLTRRTQSERGACQSSNKTTNNERWAKNAEAACDVPQTKIHTVCARAVPPNSRSIAGNSSTSTRNNKHTKHKTIPRACHH